MLDGWRGAGGKGRNGESWRGLGKVMVVWTGIMVGYARERARCRHILEVERPDLLKYKNLESRERWHQRGHLDFWL